VASPSRSGVALPRSINRLIVGMASFLITPRSVAGLIDGNYEIIDKLDVLTLLDKAMKRVHKTTPEFYVCLVGFGDFM
jgi:hypothetical protein